MSNIIEQYYAITKSNDELVSQIAAQLMKSGGSEVDVKRAWINLRGLDISLKEAQDSRAKTARAIRKSDARLVRDRLEHRAELLTQQSKSETETGVEKGKRRADAVKEVGKRQEKAQAANQPRNRKIIDKVSIVGKAITAEQFIRRLETVAQEEYGVNYEKLSNDKLVRPIVLDELKVAIQQAVAKQPRWAPGEKAKLDIEGWFTSKFGRAGESHGDHVDSAGNPTGQTVGQKASDDYVDQVVSKTYGARNITTQGDALDFDTTYRIGMTEQGEEAGGITKMISNAAFNKLQVENPELVERFGYADAFHDFMYSEENQSDPAYDELFSELQEVGMSVNAIQYWTDDDYVQSAQTIEDIKGRQSGLKQTIQTSRPNFADTQRQALRLYVNMYGTTMERNTQDRQDELKKSFADDSFFQQTYNTQKRIIDGLPIPWSQRRKLKGLIRGKGGIVTGADQAAILKEVEGFLQETRAQGQVIPQELQSSLEPQLKARGIAVYDANGELTGYDINGQDIPVGQLKYEDMVGLAKKISEENNMPQEDVDQMVQNLGVYAQHSLSGDFKAGESLNAMAPVVEAISKSPIPEIRYDLDDPTDEDLVQAEQDVIQPVVTEPFEVDLEDLPEEDLVGIESAAAVNTAMGDNRSPKDASNNAAKNGADIGNMASTILTDQATKLGGDITDDALLTVISDAYKQVTGNQFDADGEIEKNRAALNTILNSGGTEEQKDKAFNDFFPGMKGNPQFRQQVYTYLGALPVGN